MSYEDDNGEDWVSFREMMRDWRRKNRVDEEDDEDE